MGTKSFFNKQKTQEVKIRGQEKSTIDDVRENIESIDYVKEFSKDKFDFVPQLDFQDPANFVKYGSAKDYYVDLVDSVVQSYPYDGSLAERLKYRNELVAIQKHEFDKNYPRSVGVADFSDSTYSEDIDGLFTIGSAVTFGFGESNTPHYILTDNYSNKLVYNTGSNQVGSIELDFSTGATVEFWMNKSAFPAAAKTQNEVIFSISNEESDVFQITTDVTASSTIIACFAKQSSSAEFIYEFDTNLASIADSKWHHYALAFSTSSTGYVGEFYVDGNFKEKRFYTNGSPSLHLTGTLDATVGATSLPLHIGDGKLSGSLDEIRLWKTTRNAKEVGQNYFHDVGGGGNTDTTKVNNDHPLELSLYYKFNEGNTGTSSVDSVVLDYSGRLTDGVWVGYASTSRATGSAIIESGVANEAGSPIIYSTHPSVVSYKSEKTVSGSAYDAENISSMYNMLPQWISDDDAANGLVIRKLMQIMSSYLDTLHAQITAISELQDGSYVSGSNAKPNPFSKRNLISYGFDIPETFIDPGVIEEIYSKDNERIYEDKLFNLKNLIFQNIFNNLNYINKSKGTEKSFRNLFRCFGVDNELVRLNMYADNQEYEIKENYETAQAKRNTIDLSGYKDGTSRQGVIYTFADPAKDTVETGDFGFIPSSSNAYIPITFENQFQFPKYVPFGNGHLDSLSRASLFGVHSASTTTTDTTIPASDLNFKVYADTNTNNKTQFVLETNIDSIGSLTSPFYEDVYDNTNWTFAVSVKPNEYPFAPEITSSNTFNLEFYGVNFVSGYKLNEFSSSADVDIISGDIGHFLTGSNKRLYVGADRTNITGALNNRANTRLVSSRVWFDYLEEKDLQNHARDVNVFGRVNPYRNSFLFENGESGSYIPKINTLALHWNFENITGSDSTGKFLIQDITSGSSYAVDPRFVGGEYSKYVGPNYSGQGSEFPTSSTNIADFVFVDTAMQQLPENLYSSDLVEIREGDDTLFTRESRPSKYYFAVETSLYDVVSRQMLSFFASIKDFNSLIGAPVNMYRTEYKELDKLRQIFFENVQNEPDLEKYINLYKWLDGALDSVLVNLIPASGKTADKVRNVVESHILERSKYKHKFINFKEITKEEQISVSNTNNSSNKTVVDFDPSDFSGVAGNTFKIIDGTGGPQVRSISNVTVANTEAPLDKVTQRRQLMLQGLRTRRGRIHFDEPAVYELLEASLDELDESQVRDREERERALIDPDLIDRVDERRATDPDRQFSSPLNQSTKPFWFAYKADRNPSGLMSTGDSGLDFSRVQTQINITPTTTGSRQPFYSFSASPEKSIGKNTSFAGENRKNYFPNSFNGSTNSTVDGLKLQVRRNVLNRKGEPYYDYETSIDQTFGGERLLPITVEQQSDHTILAGQNYLPFVLVSASTTTISDYQNAFKSVGINADIRMSHQDFVVEAGGLQGPFTRDHVGGWMYRHDNLLVTDDNLRKEGYAIIPTGSNTIFLSSPRFRSSSVGPQFDENLPYGAYLRDLSTQRPVNIKNISGSNFFHQYQVVQTTGRRLNNRYYVKSSGFTGTINDTSSLSYDEDGVFFFKDFEILDRENTGSNKFVIVNRFSAPGGAEVNSLAFLDVESAELSVYNNLNYRNLVVRIENNDLLTRHTLTGGFDSVLLEPTGAFYKSYRNGIYKLSSSLTLAEPIFDNSYVSHGIPRTDVQYSWVASSWIARKTGYPNTATLFSTSGLLTASVRNPVFGQNDSDFNYDVTSSDYSPIYGRQFSENIRYQGEGHIEYGVGGNVPVSVAFNATNYIIVGDVDINKNLFTTSSNADGDGDFYNLPDFTAATAPFMLNGLLLSNNGPYQHPSFKQIRGGEHRVGREFAKRNLYVSNRDRVIVDAQSDRLRTVRLGDKFTISQTPVTKKYKPVTQLIDNETGSIKYSFGSSLDFFAETYDATADAIVNLNPEFNVPTIDAKQTDFFKLSSKYKVINYSENVYPRSENIYRKNTRERNNYGSFFVSDTIETRINNVLTNSQGFIMTSSAWPMDVSPSGSGIDPNVEKSGELMRLTGTLSQFWNGDFNSTKGDTGTVLEANARYSFSMGESRPDNLVQSQAGTGAFFNTYNEFAKDLRYIAQDESIIPEFSISDYVKSVYENNNGDFIKENIYTITLTGSEDLSGNSFAERYERSGQITYLKQLKEFYGEPTSIKVTFNATKKLLPREGFYPQQRVLDLAQQMSSSFINSTINLGSTVVPIPRPRELAATGLTGTQETQLMPFWAPGIGLNSIKAGFAVQYPYKSNKDARASAHVSQSFNAVAPFDAILSPSEFVSEIYHIGDSFDYAVARGGKAHPVRELVSTSSVNQSDGIYELMSHNFFAEVPEFFLQGLGTFKSSPEDTWNFEGPLSSSEGVKKFAMDVYIDNPANFQMYGNSNAFGPYPYVHHTPPGYYWNSAGGVPSSADPADTDIFLTNISTSRPAWTRARIIFDPTDLLSTENKQGEASFTLEEIFANSTVENGNYLVERDGQSSESTVFMPLSASLDLFVKDDSNRWSIRSKWECPVLNFATVDSTGSGVPFTGYTRGMWHQYGSLMSSLDANKRVNVRIDDSEYISGSLTGSLAAAVGFETDAIAFGRIKEKAIIEEAVCCVPFFVDTVTGEEKFFEIPLEEFESRYLKIRNGEVVTDSIMDMITKMDKYVIPPVYDFVGIRDRSPVALNDKKDFEPGFPPFSIYFFEFKSELTKQDLANIWQGVMPSVSVDFEKENVTLEHPIEEGQLLSPGIFNFNGLKGIPDDIRWRIFKVKKRAKYDYYQVLSEKTNTPVYKASKAGRFSFNYPYDFFSLVETGKMEAELQVVNPTPDTVKDIKGSYMLVDSMTGSMSTEEDTEVTDSTTKKATDAAVSAASKAATQAAEEIAKATGTQMEKEKAIEFAIQAAATAAANAAANEEIQNDNADVGTETPLRRPPQSLNVEVSQFDPSNDIEN